jgi:hypothetical protein
VWACFDGEGTIGEIAADLSEGLGVTPLATQPDGTILADDLDVLARISRSCEIVRIEYPDARHLLAALRDLTDRASR